MITNLIIFLAGMMVMAGMFWVASKFTEPHDGERSTDKVSKDAAERMLKLIREQEELGRIVLLVLDGEVHSMDLDAVLKQPADGLLYDLNRDKVTCSVWIREGGRTWVNNYAVALVIERLMEQKGELVEALKKQVMYLENILAPETRPVPIYRTLITEVKKRAKIALANHKVKGKNND